MTKTCLLVWAAMLVASGGAAETFLGAGPASISDRGPHHAVWSRISQHVNSYGDVVTRSNGYVVLATGMHYLSDGVWTESKEEIEVLPSGYAVARQGQHRVIWAGNANTAGAVDLYSSMDDKRFRSHVLGIAYTDKVSGLGTMFAVLKQDANGAVLGNNQVLYSDCFDPEDGVVASLRYTYTIAGFEQDLIIHNNLPPPERFGLNSATTRLELYSEFIEFPAATKQTVVLNRETSPLRDQMAEPDLTDDILDFGALRIGTGNCFPTDDPDMTMQTGKSWEIRDNNRRVMIEKVDYVTILPYLLRLPPLEARNGRASVPASLHVALPPQPRNATARDGMKMEMAKAAAPLKGFVIDYVTMGSTNNFTLRGDTEYRVTNAVSLTGTTTIEGGAVVRFASNSVAKLVFEGPVSCKTSAHLPATFTAWTDPTIGESAGSGPLSGYYGRRYLELKDASTNFNLHDLHLRHAKEGIFISNNNILELAHCQFGRGDRAIGTGTGISLTVRNVLIHEHKTGFYTPAAVKCEHATFHGISTKLVDSTGSLNLTNSLLISVTNGLAINGGYNFTNQSDAGIFATVGAGARYLASGSSLRNAGTTNISTNLLAELRDRTTFPPELLSGTTIMYVSNLTQRAARDNDSQPDLGYHYDPIDWCVGNVSVTNCNLTIEPGVVVAAFTNNGIILQKYGNLLSSGTATQLAVLTRYNMVQEEANTNWMATTPYYNTVSVETGHTNTGFTATFTKCTLPAGSGRIFYTGATNDVATLRHCQLFGGEILFEQGATLYLNNNLLVRSSTRLQHQGSNFLGSWGNNTFLGGTAHWECTNTPAANVNVSYNVFDNTTLVQSNAVTAGSNAYLTNAAPVTNVVTSDYMFPTNYVPYEKGLLGDYYLPTNIVDWGPNFATDAKLFHFTTQTNNIREGTNKLDIGFHFLALTNGLPYDSDGDGEPDYLEDDGDGAQGLQERNWLVYDTDRDYDGRNDVQETNELTNADDPLSVKRMLLGYWRFNTNTWVGEQGQWPTYTNGLQPLATWQGTAVKLPAADGALRYREVETNGSYNFNLRSGTIRFWYRPDWSSTNGGGTGPPSDARLFEVGQYRANASYGFWTLAFGGSSNSYLGFSAQSNGVNLAYINASDAPCTFISNRWYQIALTYSPSNIALYTNGQFVANSDSLRSRPGIGYLGDPNNITRFQHQGHGICYWPPANVRVEGFYLGSGGSPAHGAFEDLEIYNYPLTAQEIARDFPNFNGASEVMNDNDYDGRNYVLETYVDGTQPDDPSDAARCRLGYFRFHGPATNQTLMLGEALQHPIYNYLVTASPGWSSNALKTGSNPDIALKYRDVETNGWANFNCRNGAVSFWVKGWNGSGPGIDASLLYMGNYDGQLGSWDLWVNSAGNQINFTVASNSTVSTLLTATTNLTQFRWYHIALNYTPTNVALYVDGALLATNTGVTLWPSASDRTNGLVIGNETALNAPSQTYFEELQTFNYTLTSSEIQRQYDAVISTDQDLNGTPDLLEDSVLPASRPFVGVPFAITGTIEAEQFDLGGLGVGHSTSAVNYWTNDYRQSAMEITNCSDIGLGYCVDNLRSNDWLKYTIDVRVGQNYAMEARMAGIGTNGGVFSVEFSTNGVPYTNTGPLTVASTNWHEVTRRMTWLNKGTNVMKVSFLTNAPGSSYVGKLNFISIYPDWVQGISNIVYEAAVSTNDLMTGDSWQAATNNAARIQAAIDGLPSNMQTTNGGRVIIPVGRWHLAQAVINEAGNAVHNAAVYITRNNLELRGAGKTNTVLVGFSRSTTPLYLGQEQGPFFPLVQRTNFVLHSLTLESRPHMLSFTNSGAGGYTNDWETGAVKPGDGSVGSVFLCTGKFDSSPIAYAHNLVITNCVFKNASWNGLVLSHVSNSVVKNCDFLFKYAPDGTFPFPRSISYPSISTTITNPLGQVGFFTVAGACFNTTLIDSTFLANPSLVSVSTNYAQDDVSDGIFWGQAGGNWFIARNAITNYGLEGIAVNGAPAAVVNNTYKTLVSAYAITALNGYAGATTVNGQTNLIDNVIYFVGNSVDGGRHGELGVYHNEDNNLPYALHFCGNSITLLPAFNRSDDYPGAAVTASAMAWANISGNTLLQGAQGVRWLNRCTNAIVLKNNFAAASHRSLGYDGSDSQVRGFQIIKNALNQGKSYHLKLKYPDSGAYFLQKNSYTNGVSNVQPFLDAAASPVHIMH